MIKLLFLLTFFFTASNSNLFADLIHKKYSEVNLAVIDFEALGVSSNEAILVTDKFRLFILEESKFRVMERSVVSELLKEQGFQQLGVCNSTSCIIEAGQLLGVNYLIAGRISQVSGILAFSVRLIEVKTGEIIAASSFEGKSDFLGFLSVDIPEYSKIFLVKMQNALEGISKGSQTGLIFIEAVPANGEIFIDNEPLNKSTPATFSNIPLGKHIVTVKSSNLIGTADMIIEPGILTKCVIQLMNGVATLIVNSSPSNADCYIDGKYYSKTPIQIDTIPAGEHKIEIGMQGFDAVKDIVFLNATSKAIKNIILSPISYIHLHNINSVMDISLDSTFLNIDEKKANGSPLRIKSIPGMHILTVKQNKYYDTIIKFESKQFDTSNIFLKLTPKVAVVNFKTSPGHAVLNIFCNNNKLLSGITLMHSNIPQT